MPLERRVERSAFRRGYLERSAAKAMCFKLDFRGINAPAPSEKCFTGPCGQDFYQKNIQVRLP